MLTGPIPATRKLLDRNDLSVDDIDLFEVNEAFSSVVLAWQRELKPDTERVNVNGGAIALGHAVGATGARLIASMVAELERREADLGLVTHVLRRRAGHRNLHPTSADLIDFTEYLSSGDGVWWGQAAAEPRPLVDALIAQSRTDRPDHAFSPG